MAKQEEEEEVMVIGCNGVEQSVASSIKILYKFIYMGNDEKQHPKCRHIPRREPSPSEISSFFTLNFSIRKLTKRASMNEK